MQVNRESRKVQYLGIRARLSDARYNQSNTLTIRHGAIGRWILKSLPNRLNRRIRTERIAEGYPSEGGSSLMGYRAGEEDILLWVLRECGWGNSVVRRGR